MIYLEIKLAKMKYNGKEGWKIFDVNKVSSKDDICNSVNEKNLYMEKSSRISIPGEMDKFPIIAMVGALYFPEWVTELSLPDSMCHIEPNAFHLAEISTLHIGGGINHFSFLHRLNKLKLVTVSEKSEHLKEWNGNIYSADYKTLIWGNTGRIEVGTEMIGIKAFRGVNLYDLFIPGSVTSIGESAFENCTADKISISGNLNTIGQYAFFKCNIDELEFREGIRNPLNFETFTIFESHIRKLYLPKRTEKIYSFAFVIKGLEGVTLSGGQYQFNSLVGDFENLCEVSISLENKENLPLFGIKGLDALIKSKSMPIMAEQIDRIWCEKLYW